MGLLRAFTAAFRAGVDEFRHGAARRRRYHDNDIKRKKEYDDALAALPSDASRQLFDSILAGASRGSVVPSTGAVLVGLLEGVPQCHQFYLIKKVIGAAHGKEATLLLLQHPSIVAWIKQNGKYMASVVKGVA